MKGQIIADFLANYSIDRNDNFEQGFIWLNPTKLYFDGLYHRKGSGIEMLIKSPQEYPTKFMCKLSIKYLNNEVKYEAWIAYLKL